MYNARVNTANNNNNNNNNNNKPDFIIRDNEKGTCMLTEVANSEDGNVIKKEAEKILKYEDLTIEIQRIRNVKIKAIQDNNRGEWDYFRVI